MSATFLDPSRSVTFVTSMILLASVATIDSVTGPEVSFSVFDLIPGALAGWFAGRRQAVLVSIVSSLLWLLVELKFGRANRHWFVPYCNGFLQLGMSLFSSTL